MEEKLDLILQYIANTIEREVSEGVLSHLNFEQQSKNQPYPEIEEEQNNLREIWNSRVEICCKAKELLANVSN